MNTFLLTFAMKMNLFSDVFVSTGLKFFLKTNTLKNLRNHLSILYADQTSLAIQKGAAYIPYETFP